MRELRRVLKPNGVALLIVPLRTGLAKTWEDPSITSPEERARIFGQSDHVRNCGRDYRDRIAAEGFVVTERNVHDELAPEEVRRFGLISEPIYASRKTRRQVPGTALTYVERAPDARGRQHG